MFVLIMRIDSERMRRSVARPRQRAIVSPYTSRPVILYPIAKLSAPRIGPEVVARPLGRGTGMPLLL